MVERICPTCQHGNPLDDRYCGKCGGSLERLLPVRAGESRLALAGKQLPVTWQRVGKTVALSAAALAAEVGLAWLRGRLEGASRGEPLLPVKSAPRAQAAPETTAMTRPAGNIITIISARVVDVWDSGDGHRRIVEQTFWRKTED